jgi:hypothetical protein
MFAVRGREGRCQTPKTNVHRGALALGMVLCLSSVVGSQDEREYSCKDFIIHQPVKIATVFNLRDSVIQSSKFGPGTSLLTACTS